MSEAQTAPPGVKANGVHNVPQEAGLDMESIESGGGESAPPSEASEASTPEEGQSETEAVGDHSPVSNAAASQASPGSGAADEAAPEGILDTIAGLFEAAPGWDESAAESSDAETSDEAAEETLADASSATKGAAENGPQEFFGFLLPLLKPLIPILVQGVTQLGTSALKSAAARTKHARLLARLRKLRLPPQLSLPPQLLQAGAAAPAIKREAAGGPALTEAELETQMETLDETVSTLESVFGPDDRVRINPTTGVPWNRICHLRIKPAVGSGFFQGTGFLIGRRTIATAGHCVFMHDYGGWPQEIEVSPGRDGTVLPVPMAKATSFSSVQGWTVGKKRICDYGVIIMPQGWSMPQPTAFAYGVLADGVIQGAKLNLAGYPADKTPRRTMWYHGRKGAKATKNVIYYTNDSFGGQSGSPVWVNRNGKRTVVGFHTNGGANANSATRITRQVFANLEKWRQEGGGI